MKVIRELKCPECERVTQNPRIGVFRCNNKKCSVDQILIIPTTLNPSGIGYQISYKVTQ